MYLCLFASVADCVADVRGAPVVHGASVMHGASQLARQACQAGPARPQLATCDHLEALKTARARCRKTPLPTSHSKNTHGSHPWGGGIYCYIAIKHDPGFANKKKGAFATSGWSRQLQDADTNYATPQPKPTSLTMELLNWVKSWC